MARTHASDWSSSRAFLLSSRGRDGDEGAYSVGGSLERRAISYLGNFLLLDPHCTWHYFVINHRMSIRITIFAIFVHIEVYRCNVYSAWFFESVVFFHFRSERLQQEFHRSKASPRRTFFRNFNAIVENVVAAFESV